MDDLEKIKDRVRKLWALAQNNPSVEEAAAAAAQAQRLMEKYRLDKMMADLESGTVDEVEIGEDDEFLDTAKRLSQWRVGLASALADANSCHIYLAKGYRKTSIALVGSPEDRSMVRFMYDTLSLQIDQMCKAWCATQSFERGEGRVAGNNFRLGAVATIRERLVDANLDAQNDAKKQAQATGDASTIARFEDVFSDRQARQEAVKRWMAERLQLKKGRASNYRGDFAAYAAGRKAGNELDLGDRSKIGGE